MVPVDSKRAAHDAALQWTNMISPDRAETQPVAFPAKVWMLIRMTS
jgi:hypothetical protein